MSTTFASYGKYQFFCFKKWMANFPKKNGGTKLKYMYIFQISNTLTLMNLQEKFRKF